MIMGGEIYLPGYEKAWEIGRQLNLPIAVHIMGALGMSEMFDELATAGKFGPDNLFIHMIGISETGWKAAKDAGAGVSIAFPIEMTMRHGMPPIVTALAPCRISSGAVRMPRPHSRKMPSKSQRIVFDARHWYGLDRPGAG
jgi:cytosine/adenosine deaminase-related metal-dependent hydrolase